MHSFSHAHAFTCFLGCPAQQVLDLVWTDQLSSSQACCEEAEDTAQLHVLERPPAMHHQHASPHLTTAAAVTSGGC